VSATASPPMGSPPQYSPALRWVTTGFGMGPGGASALSATGTPHPPIFLGVGDAAHAPFAPPRAPLLLPGRPRALHIIVLTPAKDGSRHGRDALPLARAAPATVSMLTRQRDIEDESL
jgi:hypothetical protein